MEKRIEKEIYEVPYLCIEEVVFENGIMAGADSLKGVYNQPTAEEVDITTGSDSGDYSGVDFI